MLLVGCGPSDRERDCAEVRAVIAAHDDGHFAELRKLPYADREVRDAVMAVINSNGEGPRVLGSRVTADDLVGPMDRLRDLCKLTSRPLP